MRHCSATRKETDSIRKILEDRRKRKLESHKVTGDIRQGESKTTTMKMVGGLQDPDIMVESATIVERLATMQETAKQKENQLKAIW